MILPPMVSVLCLIVKIKSHCETKCLCELILYLNLADFHCRRMKARRPSSRAEDRLGRSCCSSRTFPWSFLVRREALGGLTVTRMPRSCPRNHLCLAGTSLLMISDVKMLTGSSWLWNNWGQLASKEWMPVRREILKLNYHSKLNVQLKIKIGRQLLETKLRGIQNTLA